MTCLVLTSGVCDSLHMLCYPVTAGIRHNSRNLELCIYVSVWRRTPEFSHLLGVKILICMNAHVCSRTAKPASLDMSRRCVVRWTSDTSTSRCDLVIDTAFMFDLVFNFNSYKMDTVSGTLVIIATARNLQLYWVVHVDVINLHCLRRS